MISISLLFPFFFQNHQSSSSTKNKPTKKSRATSVHAPSNDSLQPQPSTVTIQQPTHHGNRLINMTQQNDSASYVKSSYRKSSARTREYGPPVMPQKEKRQPIPSSSSSNLPSTSSSMAVSGAARLGSSHSVLTNEDELEPQQSRLTKIKVNRLFQNPEKKDLCRRHIKLSASCSFPRQLFTRSKFAGRGFVFYFEENSLFINLIFIFVFL